MQLIADSGSTKTYWRLIGTGSLPLDVYTAGINPYYQDAAQIRDVITLELFPRLPAGTVEKKMEISFYGAGCSSNEKKSEVSAVLSQCFPCSKVNVEHDLLAAARALCGRERGIVAILGTGSNSCYYDGESIAAHVPSLGFILGDEGSGAYLGKGLLRAFFYEEMPVQLHSAFEAAFHISKDEFLEQVYRKPLPNRYLASFVPFIYAHIQDPFLSDLVYNAFLTFIEHHILKYKKFKEVPFHCLGSVGWYFREILTKAACAKGIQTGIIVQGAMDGLTRYHALQ